MPRKSVCLTYDGRPKQRHKTREEAREAMWHAVNRHGAFLRGINVYPCPECGFWHVGRKKGYKPSGRRKRTGEVRTA